MTEKYFDLPGADFTIRCKIYCSDSLIRARSAQSGPDLSAEELTGGRFRRVVLFCHGFAGHRDNAMARTMAEKILASHDDTALVIFNWPAHGDDAHECISLADCDTYLDMVLSFVQEELQPRILDASATSFGGYLVLKYIRDHGEMPFRRLCLRCPAIVMHDVLMQTILTPEEIRAIETGGIVLSGFDRMTGITGAFLRELEAADLTKADYSPWSDRIRIAQGTSDELVPFAAVQSFAQKNRIEFLSVEGADHRFTGPGQMDAVIASFMDYLGF